MVRDFAERCIKISRSGDPISEEDLYERYLEWCEQECERPKKKGPFNSEIKKATESTIVRRNKIKCWNDLKVVSV